MGAVGQNIAGISQCLWYVIAPRTHRMAKWMHSKCAQIVWSCQRNATNSTLIYRFVCCLCVAHFFSFNQNGSCLQTIGTVDSKCSKLLYTQHTFIQTFIRLFIRRKRGTDRARTQHNIYDKTYWNIVDWVTRVCFCFYIWPHSTIEATKKKLRGKNVERRRKRGCNGYTWKFSKCFVSLNGIAQFSHQIFSLLKLLLLRGWFDCVSFLVVFCRAFNCSEIFNIWNLCALLLLLLLLLLLW